LIVSRLADFASDLTYATLPDAVRHAAKRCLLDWLGAAICGSPVPPATLMTTALADELGHGRARLVPSGTLAPLRTAALINGTAAHAMEVDDIFREGVYHPGSPVIAAALAAAQHAGASGAELLAAIVAGYEISNPVAAAMQPAHYDFWHTTGIVGAIGAAAGADFERRLLARAMADNRHNQTEAAQSLGLGYHQFRRLIKKHGVQ